MSAGAPFDESPPASAITPGLHVSVEHHDAAVVVRVAGDVDLTNAAQLQDSIEHALEGQAQVVVVDLTGVNFFGSAGLAVLVAAHRRDGDHARVRVVAGTSVVYRTMKITGLTTELAVYPTVHHALADSNRRGPTSDNPNDTVP